MEMVAEDDMGDVRDRLLKFVEEFGKRPGGSSPNAERDVLAANHPLVRELLDIIVREATRLASTSSNHSADDLLRAAGYYSLGEIPRMLTRRCNAWNLFLCEEKANVPEHLRKQNDGASYNNSRPGIKVRQLPVSLQHTDC
jgi:hypothetical protein